MQNVVISLKGAASEKLLGLAVGCTIARSTFRRVRMKVPNICRTNSALYIKETPWPKSARELYRPSDSRLSAKLVPTFADRGMSRGQLKRFLRSQSRFSRPEPLLFLPGSSSVVLTRLSGPRSRPTTSQELWPLGRRGSLINLLNILQKSCLCITT
jgi:hypothetical protein